MLKMDYILTKPYMEKFIADNKDILEYVYTIQIAEDEWYFCVGYEIGKVDEFNADALPAEGEIIDWSFRSNTGEMLSELAAMRECGFLEQEKLPNIG